MPHSIADALRRCTPEDRAELLRSVPAGSLRALNACFSEWAHEGQLAPAGDWRVWVMMAGRGFGKTRSGAEWVLGLVRGGEGAAVPRGTQGGGRRFDKSGEGGRGVRVALVAATLDEARRVMVEGPSGILALARPGEVEEWSFARRTVRFAGGAEATLFSGAHPEGLRGPEHDYAWCDELAKWRRGAESWGNLQLGLRRGGHPRALVSTTPRRAAGLRAVLGEEGVVVTGGRSRDNPHLPDAWLGAMERMHGGTLNGRQELGGELVEDVEGALWPRVLMERCRVPSPSHPTAPGGALPLPLRGEGPYRRVVIGVDPPASAGGDACGIVAVGLGRDGIGYVLGDHSVRGASPEGWAGAVAGAAEAWSADRVIAEKNNGGDMVRSVMNGAGRALPLTLVHASRGKCARAEPVAALFEAGRARFAGAFPELEDELAGLQRGGGYEGPGRSPDRADAMVWALTELMLTPVRAEPAVRQP